MRPYLQFPGYNENERQSGSGGPLSLNLPGRERQTNRLNGPMQELQRTMLSRLATLQEESPGIAPEMVLVLEIAGSINDFYVAVKNTEGFSWLLETITEDITEDEDFYKNEEPSGENLRGKLYLLMTNRKALENLLELWEIFNNRDTFPRGQTKWRDIFKHLKDIRPWDVKDRLEDTGLIEDWEKDLEIRNDRLSFEVEFWFNEDEDQRELIEENFIELLKDLGGEKVDSTSIPEIKYHGILAKVPSDGARTLISSFKEGHYNKLLKSEYVMFFNPTPQADLFLDQEDLLSQEIDYETEDTEIEQEPVIALFDGLPLQNHKSLKDKLIIDDPDNFGDDYPPKFRTHGTAMASIILNGDLNKISRGNNRRLYVRPVLKLGPLNPINKRREEIIPEDRLFIDLVYNAVKRLFEGDEDSQPVAPNIKVINFSIGDSNRPFIRQMSALSRLLDWLSWKYRVLFIVSAGNYIDNINIENLDDADDLAEKSLKSINSNLIDRRIISPAESINALTVGAGHYDYSNFDLDSSFPYIYDLFDGYSNFPSPISRFGLGFDRSIKPDIFMPGGRQLYLKRGSGGDSSLFKVSKNIKKPPGIKVAFPGESFGLSSYAFLTGTSNAAAMVSHKAAQIYELLENNRDKYDFDDDLIPVMIKALLAHYGSWGDAYESLSDILSEEVNVNSFRRHAQKLLGYGFLDYDQKYG
ncbi:MAG: S8 family peptidase, partial [bacterium]